MSKFLNYLSVTFLCFLAVFSFSACGGNDEDPTKPGGSNAQSITAAISESSLIFDSQSTTEQLTITVKGGENISWEIISDAYWCDLDRSYGYESGTYTINVSCSNNMYDEDRSATLTLIVSDLYGNEKTACCTVTQKGKETMTLTKNQFEIEKAGGEFEVEIKSNIQYTYVIEDDAKGWIHESPTSTRAAVTTSHLQFKVDENEYAKRVGHITLKGNDMTEAITVYQDGDKESIVLTSSDYYVSKDGETLNIVIKSNTIYEIEQPDVTWIKDVTQQTRAMMTHNHFFEVSPNNESESRSTKLIVKSNNITEYISITQAGKAEAEITINVAYPGSLSSMISADRRRTLTSVKITGALNSSDKKVIDEMTNLSYLDLEDADLGSEWNRGVSGAPGYLSWSPIFPSSVKHLILPKNLKKITFSTHYSPMDAGWSLSFSAWGYRIYYGYPSTLQDSQDSRLETVVVQEGCEELSSFANTELKHINIPSTLKKIEALPGTVLRVDIANIDCYCKIQADYRILGKNSKLYVNNKLITDLEIPNGITHLSRVFENCKQLSSIKMPSSLTSIADYALSGCTGITSIDIPSSVTSIGNYAFSGCSISEMKINSFAHWAKVFNRNNTPFSSNNHGRLIYNGKKVESVEIPSSISQLDGAYSYVEGIKEVHCKSTTPIKLNTSSYSGDFNLIDKNTATLYVPKGTKQAYNLSDWGVIFKNIVEE